MNPRLKRLFKRSLVYKNNLSQKIYHTSETLYKIRVYFICRIFCIKHCTRKLTLNLHNVLKLKNVLLQCFLLYLFFCNNLLSLLYKTRLAYAITIIFLDKFIVECFISVWIVGVEEYSCPGIQTSITLVLFLFRRTHLV